MLLYKSDESCLTLMLQLILHASRNQAAALVAYAVEWLTRPGYDKALRENGRNRCLARPQVELEVAMSSFSG